MTHDGIPRTYCLHLPQAYAELQSVPLVIALHGGGGDGPKTARLTGFNALADREGFIVVYPEGINHHWNDGRLPDRIADDVGFISALLDKLQAEYRIDPTRVYVTGPSNGAMMTYRLAYEMTGRIAAAAPVIGSIPLGLKDRCRPSGPMPMLIINGDADPLVPYGGGEVRVGRQRLGRLISTDDTIQFWVAQNGCTATPSVADLPDKDTSDGATVTRSMYTSPASDKEVILYRVRGGGHTWPGGPQYLPKWIVGTVCRDFNASEIIWEFFQRHHRPPAPSGKTTGQ